MATRPALRGAKVLFLGCLAAALTDGAWAGVNLWTTNGPGSPQVTALAADPVTPTTIYLGTYDGRIFKSTNGGVSWTAKPFSSPAVRALAVDPLAPATLYAATNVGLYKSSNAGDSWSAISSGIPFPLIQAVAVDPAQSGTLYAANFYNRLTGEGGIYKSTNGGKSWVPILTGFFGSIVVDPGNPSIVYAGRRTVFQGPTGTVVKSTDGGASWSALPINGDVYAVVLDPLDPARLYAGLDGGGVLRSVDGGENWSAGTGLTNVFVRVMAISAAAPSTVFAGTLGGGVFRSVDSAMTWTAVNSGVGPQSFNVDSLATAGASTVYRGSFGGRTLLKSEDSGETWTSLSVRLANANVTSLALDPANPAVIYAGTSLNGDEAVFKSTNEGMSWTGASGGLPSNLAVRAMAVDPFDPLVVYADHFKSTNGGVSWTSQTSPPPSTIFSLVADRTTPNVLYAGAGDTAGGGAGIYKSIDGGEHWTRAVSPVPLFDHVVRALAIDPATPSTLYAVVSDNRLNSTDGGVLKSTDGGETFGYVLPGQNASSVAVDPASPSTVYAGFGGKIWKSVNGGLTWSPLDVHAEVTDIAINPARPSEVYAAAGVVFRSLDGGASWGTFNSGLTYGVQELRIRPDGNLLHGASTGGGVYEHEIRALSFYTVAPCRVVDTRGPVGAYGGPALGADTFRIFQLAGRCGIPSTAVTVVANLTVAQPAALGHLRVFPEGTPLPEASNINYGAGQTRANNGLLALSPAGEVSVYCKQVSGTAHLILDVVGYFQ